MKHKLLSLAALSVALFTSASAFGYDEPVAPEKPTTAGAFTSGHCYFIRNVGAGQYITGGNSWSTQISLTRDGIDDELNPAILLYISDSTATIAGAQVTGYSMKINGSYVFNGASGARTIANLYFFRDDDAQGFIDHGSQDKGYIWSISKEGDYYRIQTAAGDPAYPNAEMQYAGWLSTDGEIGYDEYGVEMGSTIVFFNLEEGQDDANIDWEFIPADDYLIALDAFSSKEALYNTLVEAEDAGVNIDAALKVYENPTASKAEVEKAIADLKVAIAKAQYDFSGASEEDPLDVTDQVLVNPAFDTGDISGWTTNYVSGQQANNIGYQGASYTNGDVTISQFIEAWKSDGSPWTIGDGYLQQTVYGLPQGKYVLECDAISNYQWADHTADGSIGKNPAEGVYLFIQAGENETKQALATGNGQPEHFSVTFINDGSSDVLTFGLKTEKATANWIAADNFTITYYGETQQTAAQAILSSAIKAAQDDLDLNEEEYNPCNKEIEDALKSAIAAGQPLTMSGSDEDCTAATEAINTAKAAYDKSIAEYKTLWDLIKDDGKMAYYEEISAGISDELNDQINKMWEELRDGYNNGTATSEDIAEVSNLMNTIRDYIKKEGIKPGTDVTILLDNPGFDEGTTANPTGWTINSGSLTELRHSTSNIETWHKTFDISQTITDMPAGVYDITVQGFVRHDSGGNETVFYAGDITTTLMTLEDQWSLEPIWGEATDEKPAMGDSNYDLTLTTPDGEVGYKANGMTGAYYWFQTEIPTELYESFKYTPQEGDNYYTNHIKAVLTEAGDFTIGLKTTSTTDWVIWDNFQIKYLGEEGIMEAYYELIKEAAKHANEAIETAENPFITKAGQDKLDAMNKQVEDLSNITSGEQAMAFINEINATEEYILEGNQKGELLISTYGVYTETLSATYDIQDESWFAFLEDVQTKIDEPSKIADNDAIDALINEMKSRWSAAVLAGAEDEPAEKFDATAVIYNPHYDGYDDSYEEHGTSEGWTIENIGGAAAANWREQECYNNDSINVYQTIEGLKEGFYEIAVQGYYRAGFAASINAETPAENVDSIRALYTTHNAFIYAITGEGEFKSSLKNAMEDAQEYTLGMGAESEVTVDEAVYYIPNNMEAANGYFSNDLYNNALIAKVAADGKLTIAVKKVKHIEGDWTIFTNWQLFYLGKTGANFSEEIDAVENLKANSFNAAQIFAIDGRQQNTLSRGINIIRTSDGNVRKVLVK